MLSKRVAEKYSGLQNKLLYIPTLVPALADIIMRRALEDNGNFA